MTEQNDIPIQPIDEDEALPPLTKDLVEWLDRLIPEACPNLNMQERAIWFYAGQRHIVNVLKHRLRGPEEE